MQELTAFLLAVIQGLTEFVPVSSSGHLALTQYFLGFSESPVAFDLVLHLGTLVAVTIYYRQDIAFMLKEVARPSHWIRPDWTTDNPGKLLALLFIACLPTAAMGFALKSKVEHAFSDIHYVAVGFLIGGAMMMLTLKRKVQNRSLADMNVRDAFVIGAVQGVALFPGISRSGSTISAALLLGIHPVTAGRFSFLLSIPAVLGAFLLEMRLVLAELHSGRALLLYASSGVVAGIVGYLSIRPMIRILQAAKFHYFAYYCWAVGLALLICLH